MYRLRFCIVAALLLAVVAGCDNSTAPIDSAGVQPNESTGDASTIADDPQPTRELVDSQPESDIAQSTNTTATESATLKQAMIDVAADLMKEQQPNTAPDAVRSQVEKAIAQIRKDIPDFLMVSAETEEKLQAGTPVEGAARRIADAEAFFNEYGLPLSGLVKSLLPQFKAGTLNPVRTELLAQLVVADMKKAQHALTN